MMTLQKIGLHILNGYAGPLGRPRICKLVDPTPQYIRDVRALVGDGCTLVVRWTLRGTALERQPLDAPIDRARQWMALYSHQMADPAALYEGYNEVPDSQAGPFAAFEVERLRLLHGAGLRCAVGSWSRASLEAPALRALS